MSTETFAIGQGVKDAMAEHGDEPRSDEQYGGDDGSGHALYSLTHGRDAMYRWTPQDGVRRLPFGEAPAPTARAFGVWNGVTILHSLSETFARVKALTPPGDWQPEWYPKAGEGGTWQRDLSDPNGLSGEAMLATWVAYGKQDGVAVVPYVVVRGRAAWNTAEWAQVAACVRAAGRCILNLEPGAQYWNGGTTPEAIDRYMDGVNAAGAPDTALELCAIPRTAQVNELGGPAALGTWLDRVARASWECYEDSPAPALAPGYAIPNVVQPLTSDPLKQIPLVQRSMIGRYADSEWTANGCEVWHLDGS